MAKRKKQQKEKSSLLFVHDSLLFSHPAEPLYLFMLGKALDLVITEKIIFLFVEFSTNIKVSLSFRQ